LAEAAKNDIHVIEAALQTSARAPMQCPLDWNISQTTVGDRNAGPEVLMIVFASLFLLDEGSGIDQWLLLRRIIFIRSRDHVTRVHRKSIRHDRRN
jgi:hypothetical protein